MKTTPDPLYLREQLLAILPPIAQRAAIADPFGGCASEVNRALCAVQTERMTLEQAKAELNALCQYAMRLVHV